MNRIAGLIDVYLKPGEWYVADARYQIRTMLGSCVSIALWHPTTRVGGMSHFLLPSRGGALPGVSLDGHYGDEALELMLSRLRIKGVEPATCQAKIFGGGNMFPDHSHPGAINVGARNGNAARMLLRDHGIPIVSENLFGVGHRQIIFDVSKGDVWAHQVKPTVLVAEDK